MARTKATEELLEQIGAGVSLDDTLASFTASETELRRLWATNRTDPRVQPKYVGLINVFDIPSELRVIHARAPETMDDVCSKFVMPLDDSRRKKSGEQCMTRDITKFKENWAIFTENMLRKIDFRNVIAAGGSVLACLMALPNDLMDTRNAIKFHYTDCYPSSDIDLFLWGLTPQEAKMKIVQIEKAIRDAVPCDTVCIRTKNTISVHSRYPYRPVQIVLRLYDSPAEVLAGFDVDVACCAYDGHNVYASPRAVIGILRQCIVADTSRRSPSYEARLSKYASRGFEIYVPSLNRSLIDPTIYERDLKRIRGLARLLVIEKLTNKAKRHKFLEARHTLRGRAHLDHQEEEMEGETAESISVSGDTDLEKQLGPEFSDYDPESLRVPYGPGWDVTDVIKLICSVNSSVCSRHSLHCHIAFYGTAEECINGCCKQCDNLNTRATPQEKNYVYGSLQFITDNPGRQMLTGSFNPIDDGEWCEQAHLKDDKGLFNAITSGDRDRVMETIRSTGNSIINQRDFVGRMPLHTAIFSGQNLIACDLIDAGAQIRPRLADGRTPLHCAAQLGMQDVIRKIMEKSAATLSSPASDNESSECDSVDMGASKNDYTAEDDKQLQDTIDIDDVDWDLSFTPLSYAIIFSSITTINTLLSFGASVAAHSLILAVYRADMDKNESYAVYLAKRLLQAGARWDMSFVHLLVQSNKPRLLQMLLKFDPNVTAVLNLPFVVSRRYIFPVVCAISHANHEMFAVLVSHGAKITFDANDLAQVLRDSRTYSMSIKPEDVICALAPLEAAIANLTELAYPVVSLGAKVNVATRNSLCTDSPTTLLDWVHQRLETLTEMTREENLSADRSFTEPAETSWMTVLNTKLLPRNRRNETLTSKEKKKLLQLQGFFADMKLLLEECGGMRYTDGNKDPHLNGWINSKGEKILLPLDSKYYLLSTGLSLKQTQGPHSNDQMYDELFQAAFSGNDEKLFQLCLEPQREGAVPAQVAAEIVYQGDDGYIYRTGLTPLIASIEGRQWRTARALLVASMTQYKTKCLFPAVVPIHPAKILDCPLLTLDGAVKYRNPLEKSVKSNDLVAFVNIADLYRLLSPPLDLDDSLLLTIIENDHSDILDEYIRRTGKGVFLLESSLHQNLKNNDQIRSQLDREDETSLLWLAIEHKATKIIDYLGSARPLHAYRFYGLNNTNEWATTLRTRKDLHKILPVWLGWSINAEGESPLTAAILGNDLGILQSLYEHDALLMTEASQKHLLGYNLLMAAVVLSDLPIVRFLLARRISPTEIDPNTGYNIYHIAVLRHRCDLVDYLLGNLPHETSEFLLTQKSTSRLRSTPFHLAVEAGFECIVASFVAFGKKGSGLLRRMLLTRDIVGNLPLHIAAAKGYHLILSEILNQVESVESSHTENAVGCTVSEICYLKAALRRNDSYSFEAKECDDKLHLDMTPERLDRTQLEMKVPKLKKTVTMLQTEYCGRPGEMDWMKKWHDFTSHMEKRLFQIRDLEVDRPPCRVREEDYMASLKIVLEATSLLPGKREPVPLQVVQDSVAFHLNNATT